MMLWHKTIYNVRGITYLLAFIRALSQFDTNLQVNRMPVFSA